MVTLVAASTQPHRNGGTEHLVVMEWCAGGHLLDLVNARAKHAAPLGERELLALFAQVLAAVGHLHAQRPPIQHRDLKLENLLLLQRAQAGGMSGAGQTVKLCDFGSCVSGVVSGLARD